MREKIKSLYDKYVANFVNYCSRRSATKKLQKLENSVKECSLVVGMPGTGKTTLCAYIVSLCLKANKRVFCNVPIIGATPFTKEEFGKYDMSDSWIILDEASLFYDNRSFEKNFNQESLEYLKLLRHRNNHCLVLSQSVDVDVKWVRMSNKIFQLTKPTLLSMFTTVTPIVRELDINEQTHKFEDFYYKPRGLAKFIKSVHLYRPKYYKYFDSYDAPQLPSLTSREVYKSKQGISSFTKKTRPSIIKKAT